MEELRRFHVKDFVTLPRGNEEPQNQLKQICICKVLSGCTLGNGLNHL